MSHSKKILAGVASVALLAAGGGLAASASADSAAVIGTVVLNDGIQVIWEPGTTTAPTQTVADAFSVDCTNVLASSFTGTEGPVLYGGGSDDAAAGTRTCTFYAPGTASYEVTFQSTSAVTFLSIDNQYEATFAEGQGAQTLAVADVASVTGTLTGAGYRGQSVTGPTSYSERTDSLGLPVRTFTYELIGFDGESTEYTVTFTQIPSSEKSIESLSIDGYLVEFPAGVTSATQEVDDLSAITGEAQGKGFHGVSVDLTNTTEGKTDAGLPTKTFTYTVKAQDGSTADYTVTFVQKAVADSEKLASATVWFDQNEDGNVFRVDPVEGVHYFFTEEDPANDNWTAVPEEGGDGPRIAPACGVFTVRAVADKGYYVGMNTDENGNLVKEYTADWSHDFGECATPTEEPTAEASAEPTAEVTNPAAQPSASAAAAETKSTDKLAKTGINLGLGVVAAGLIGTGALLARRRTA